jgi:hypothetical protein
MCPEGRAHSVVLDDLTSGVANEGEAMFMHPDIHIWLQEQDRERAMAQNALERAARAGGTQRPGLVRGGISSFARLLRRAAGSRATTASPSPQLTGPSGA